MDESTQVIINQESTTLLEIISSAAKDKSTDVAKMEQLFSLYERVQARESEVEFNRAMNAAQSDMRRIAADATNNQTRSQYATYAGIDRIVRPIYTKHGFSLSFDTGDSAQDMVRVVCYVSHSGGHSRQYHADIPADGKGAKGGDVMTKTHAVGSGMSYGTRYLLKMIFNVAIGLDDDDGNSASGDDGTADWIAAIESAMDRDGLGAIRAALKDSPTPTGAARTKVVSAWNARLKAISGESK